VFWNKWPLPTSHDKSNSCSDTEGLHISPNCQFVVCSIDNLKDFWVNMLMNNSRMFPPTLTRFEAVGSFHGIVGKKSWMDNEYTFRAWRISSGVHWERIEWIRLSNLRLLFSCFSRIRSVWLDGMFQGLKQVNPVICVKMRNESDLEGMDSDMVRRPGIEDPILRTKVVCGIRLELLFWYNFGEIIRCFP